MRCHISAVSQWEWDYLMKFVVSLSLILLLNFTSLSAANGQAPLSPQLRSSIEQLDKMTAAEYAKDNIGSVTVGIVVGSNLVWTKSYGYADM